MKDRLYLGIIIVLAAAVGCLGTLAFQSTEARAQAPTFRRCFFADFDAWADGNNPQHMAAARGALSIPAGWTVAPGSGADLVGVTLCQ